MKKSILLLLVALLALGAYAQQDSSLPLAKTIKGGFTDFSVDNLGNIFLLDSNNQLKKLSPNGDSIAIFLNGHLLREHILLGSEPQTIKINAADLQDDNELVLVAENLGSIPPNTSDLVAYVGSKRYEARLFADEGTSAMVRFVKEKEK